MTKPDSAAPSLLETNTASPQSAPSLLSTLGNTTPGKSNKKKGRSSFWMIALPLLLISLVVSAAVMIANNAASAFKPVNHPVAATATPPVQDPVTVQPPQAAAPVAVKVVAPLTPVQTPQVATIINDQPVVSPEKNAAHAPSSTTKNPHDVLSAALTSTQPPVSTSPAVAKHDKPAVIHAATEPVSPGKSAKKEIQASNNSVVTKGKPERLENDDRDINLLTALVASTKDISAKKSNSHPADTKSVAENKAAAESKTAMSKDDSRNQDIVERKAGDSTAGLLKRCKKLGVIEGELCRWRICSERWDSDPACKASAQPKATAANSSAQ